MPLLFALLPLVPAMFAPRPGWHVGHTPVRACVSVPASRCLQSSTWAATVPWRGCGACLPHAMIEALPVDGIALQVSVAVEHPRFARHGVAWPPRIQAVDVVAGFEGVSSRYGVFQAFARSRRIEVFIWAFFGRAHPTRAQLARANAELRAVRIR